MGESRRARHRRMRNGILETSEPSFLFCCVTKLEICCLRQVHLDESRRAGAWARNWQLYDTSDSVRLTPFASGYAFHAYPSGRRHRTFCPKRCEVPVQRVKTHN